MNADELLRHYERIADAPEAVARLRAFVVELAVRGRLFGSRCEAGSAWPQLPLARLLAEDTRNGYSRRPDDAPDGVPILRISAGTVRADGIVAEEEHKLISGIDASTRELYGLKAGDLLACRFNGNKRFVGSLSLFKDYSGLRPIYPDKLIRIRLERSLVEPRFLLVAASSAMVRERVETMCATTVGNWGISASNLKTVRFPVPPLAEQHRIVAKVDELMALCDGLEAARTRREAARDRLARSCLARLDTPDPETFHDDARFALDALPALTARPDQIKLLRQTILNLAVRGKLVPQDPKDGPASELLRQIAATRHSLGITSEPTAISLEEVPFELPRGWSWSRIGEVCTKTGSGSTPRGGQAVYASAGVPFLRSQNVYNNGLRLDDVVYIDATTHARMAGTAVRAKDLLLNITGGSIGRCCRVPDNFAEANISQHVAILRAAVPGLTDFLHRVVLSPYFQSYVVNEQTGAGRGGLPKNRMDRIAVALPPHAEQHRIVAKVDELMALCDQLEASLTRADEHRRRLLEALLHKALEPARLQEQAA